MPVGLRVHLAHATVQAVAMERLIRILHIKGPATDPSLQPHSEGTGGRSLRQSTDADVLVDPAEAGRFVRALQQHGWRVLTTFKTGSIFEHAATLWHTELGFADVHRTFPGVELDPNLAFDDMWDSRHDITIAHQPCQAPAISVQRLLLLLHAARNGGPANPAVAQLWTDATDAQRQDVQALARTLDAEVALAAAVGGLDAYADRPTYDLWRTASRGDRTDRIGEWRARWKAAPSPRARLGIAARAALVNIDHLGMSLGRRPTVTDVIAEYLRRVRRVSAGLWRIVTRRHE